MEEIKIKKQELRKRKSLKKKKRKKLGQNAVKKKI
jgi:hypothetical protein